MKHLGLLVLAGTLGLAVAGCGGGTTRPFTSPTAPPPTGQYTQIELLARPAVKELFEKFVDHQITNAVEPYNDPTLQGEIQTFTDSLRPPKNGADYGKALAGVLYPNEYTVDLSQTGGAAYLGTETGGATSATKSTFGGRGVADDVIDISLGAVFGNTLSALGLIADDGQENNCLSKENVTQNATQAPGATFPYLAGPH
jgi:hypothetical protein